MNILRLIRKDLLLQRWFLVALIFLEIAGVAILRVQMPTPLPGVVLLLTSGLALVGNFLVCYRTTVSEEKNRAMLFVRCLPVSTYDIVAGKFLVNLLIATANAATLLALYSLWRLTPGGSGEPALTLPAVGIFAGGLWLSMGFFACMALVFDSERAMWLPFPALFLVISAILNFRKIVEALHAEAIVDALSSARILMLPAIAATVFGMFLGTVGLVRRKRMFG